jgi:hypothetical protein
MRASHVQMKFEKGQRMPTIKFTRFEAEFATASEAGEVLKTVLSAAGFQVIPEAPRASSETARAIAAPAPVVDKPRRKYQRRLALTSANGQHEKQRHPNQRSVNLHSQAHPDPPAGVVDAGKRLTVSAAIRMVLGKGPMAARQVFDAVVHAGLTTAFPTVQSLLYQAEKQEWVTRSEGGIYAITEKGRNVPR